MLEGELELELDNGVKTIMRKNDVAAQRGTIHAWRNVGVGTARMMFVLVPSKPVKVGEKELEETGFPQNEEYAAAASFEGLCLTLGCVSFTPIVLLGSHWTLAWLQSRSIHMEVPVLRIIRIIRGYSRPKKI